MTAVSVRDLTVRFGTRAIFEDFSLDVERGETLAILGPSGCGKSTLLRAIGGLVVRDAGTIDTDGEIGLVFQEPRLMPWLTVEKNVAFAARGDVERARVKDAIDLVGLSNAAHLLPKALSGGMAQRTSLARSLVRSPNLLLLDEPLSALDALARLDLQTAIARIVRETASTAILVTHDVDEALYLADRIVVLTRAPAKTAYTLAVPEESRRVRSADLTRERKRAVRGARRRYPARGHPRTAAQTTRAREVVTPRRGASFETRATQSTRRVHVDGRNAALLDRAPTLAHHALYGRDAAALVGRRDLARPTCRARARTWTIPRGTHVVLDVDPPRLGRLAIDGDLAAADRDLRLEAGSIAIRGTFAIGSPDRRFTHRARIVLDASGRERGIASVTQGGRFDLFGERVKNVDASRADGRGRKRVDRTRGRRRVARGRPHRARTDGLRRTRI